MIVPVSARRAYSRRRGRIEVVSEIDYLEFDPPSLNSVPLEDTTDRKILL
jgi:hypothetical protein